MIQALEATIKTAKHYDAVALSRFQVNYQRAIDIPRVSSHPDPKHPPVDIRVHCPYYAYIVPKEPLRLAEFRDYVLHRGARDPNFGDSIRCMCHRDLLFYVNVFGWLYEPRERADGAQGAVTSLFDRDEEDRATTIMFNTWPVQDDSLIRLSQSFNRHSMTVKKSRDMSGTWMVIYGMSWRCQFRRGQSFLWTSRNEEMVQSDHHAALFSKLDFVHYHLPGWLLPDEAIRRRKASVTCRYVWSESGIRGEASTEQFSQGSRETAVFIDELERWEAAKAAAALRASDRVVTNCRVVVSTPGDEYHPYEKMLREQPPDRVILLPFHTHPEKARGLYEVHPTGKIKRCDPAYEYPRGYKFNDRFGDEMVEEARSDPRGFVYRSAAFDLAAGDAFDFDAMRVNWLMKPRTASTRVVPREKVIQLIALMVRTPLRIGRLRHDRGVPVVFEDATGADLRLWCQLDGAGRPPPSRYVIGVDVSAGTGATESTACVIDAATFEQVGEYANRYLQEHEHAEQVAALARWFHNAVVVWEAQGPGVNFGMALMRTYEYRYVYYPRRLDGKVKAEAGISTGGGGAKTNVKTDMFKDFVAALENSLLTIRSESSLEQLCDFVYIPGGRIAHQRSVMTDTPPDAQGKNHGDRATACIMAWQPIRLNRTKLNRLTSPRPSDIRKVLEERGKALDALRRRTPNRRVIGRLFLTG